jgi:BirA family biotin operon repressor/biotin-[acetyl-CoA-carboxylase] ligase
MIPTVDKSRQASGRDGEARGPDCDAIARAADLDRSRIECVDEIASTNSELMNRPAALDPLAPQVLIAARQSAGRGRRGRSWLSEAPECLAMSICMHRVRSPGAAPLVGLPLALGAAVATTVAQHVRGIGLKWPNDLLRDGRKCAGMLVETRAIGEFDRVVVGLGLNWWLPPALARSVADAAAGATPVADARPRERGSMPSPQPPGGLFDASPPQALRERIAGELAGAIIERMRQFFDAGFGDTAVLWARFDALSGRDVVIHADRERVLTGRAEGIDRQGALRVRTADGVVAVAAGEVSARLLDDVVSTEASR